MSVTSIVRRCIQEVPHALAAGLVDLTYGTLVALESTRDQPEGIADILGPATKQIFERAHFSELGSLLQPSRSADDADAAVQEILIASAHSWHHYGRLSSEPRIVMTVIVRADTSIGLFLVKTRAVRDSIESVWI